MLAVTMQRLQHFALLSLLDESQPWMNTVLPVLNVPEPDALNVLLYPPAPFECLDNGQLVTSIQSTPSVALFRAAVALGAQPPFIEHHNILQINVSLQVTPISIQRQEANATILAWDQFVLMWPERPTVDNLPVWWQPASCESYFSNNQKKTPTHQAAGPFARFNVQSPTPMDEDWQNTIAAAKAAAEHDAQVTQQIRDDGAEVQCLQDIFDLLGPDQQFDETSLATGPLESPNSSASIWGTRFHLLHAGCCQLFSVSVMAMLQTSCRRVLKLCIHSYYHQHPLKILLPPFCDCCHWAWTMFLPRDHQCWVNLLWTISFLPPFQLATHLLCLCQ